jgi:nucleoprotein TPR
MMKITVTLLLVYLSATMAFGQTRPGAPIETAKKIRESRPSFTDLVGEVDQLSRELIELRIEITEANTARLKERNEDFRKTTEARREHYEKVIEILEKIEQLKTDFGQIKIDTVTLRSEFDSRGKQLLQSNRNLTDAETRLAETEAQIDEMEVFNDERFSSLSGRLDAMEATIQSINAEYLKQVDYEDREKKLLTRIVFLEESNQTLLQRFQVSETLIQQLGEQILNTADNVATVSENVTNQARLMEQVQKQIVALESLSTQLDSLTQKDIQLEEEVIKVNDLRLNVEAITADLYLVQNELLRVDSDARKLDDVSKLTLEDLNTVLRRLDEVEINQVTKLTLEDLTAVLSRLDEVEINQVTKLDSRNLDAVLQRIDDLEAIQPQLGEQNLLRDRVDELLYQQSLFAEDLERLNRIEDKLMLLEEKFDSDRISSEVKEEAPMTQYPAQPVDN